MSTLNDENQTVNATKLSYKSNMLRIDKWLILRLFLLFLFFLYVLNKKFNVTEMDWLLFHPERGHYSGQQFIESKSNRLFEGWYYKIANKDFQLAIIPGAYHSINHNGNYAFIMFVTTDFCYEYRYPLDQYIIDKGDIHTDQQFFIDIGPNKFSRNSISLFLESKYIHSIQPLNYKNKSEPIKIDIKFFDQDRGFPLSLFQLGAMGYYGWIPILECYHGILSMNFLVYGTINIGNNIIYDNNQYNKKSVAHGYLEKDWGTNFPQTWIWIQASHFDKDENVSLTLALARLPIVGDSIYTKPGFLGGLYINNKIYRFGTFTWSKVKTLNIDDDNDYRQISIVIEDFLSRMKLQVIATIPNAYNIPRNEAMKIYPHLLVPQSNGKMKATLMEWINATVWIRFIHHNNDFIFESQSYPATVECHGDDNMNYILNNFGDNNNDNNDNREL